jgi:hypothetical protein
MLYISALIDFSRLANLFKQKLPRSLETFYLSSPVIVIHDLPYEILSIDHIQSFFSQIRLSLNGLFTVQFGVLCQSSLNKI